MIQCLDATCAIFVDPEIAFRHADRMASENEDDIESVHSSMEVPVEEYDGQRTFKRRPKQTPEEPKRNDPRKKRNKSDTDDLELVKTKAPWGEYKKPKRKRRKKGKTPKPGKLRDGLSSSGKTPASTGQVGITKDRSLEVQGDNRITSSLPGHIQDNARFSWKGAESGDARVTKRGFFASLFPQGNPRSVDRGQGDSEETGITGSDLDDTGGQQPVGTFGQEKTTSDWIGGGEYVRESPGNDSGSTGRARIISGRQREGQRDRKGSLISETGGTMNPISKLQNTLRRKKSVNATETTSYRSDTDAEEGKRRPLVNRLTRRKSNDLDEETTGEFKERSIKERGGNLKAKTNRKKSVASKAKDRSSYRDDAKERATTRGKRSKWCQQRWQ